MMSRTVDMRKEDADATRNNDIIVVLRSDFFFLP